MTSDRVAFVYEHLHPHSIGGAERYYAALAEELGRDGPVSYITRAYPSGPEGVELVALAPAGPEPAGFVRRNLRKLRFCLALAWHLARRGGRYGVVHCCSFPQAAVLAARVGLLRHRRTLLVADWHEVLSRDDWRGRLGRVGEAGRLVQRLAARSGGAAVTFSRLHEQRLRAEGRRGEVAVLREFPPEGHVPERVTGEREPLVVFAGRLVPQKRAHLVPAVVAELRRRDPAWRGVVFGDGPERERVERAAAELADGAVRVAGFAPWDEVAAALVRARALVLPTTREGFGLAVLEAAAHGCPSVLVAEPDNAAVELLASGEAGAVCPDAEPATLAAAVLAFDAGAPARARAWFDRGGFTAARAAADLRVLHDRLRRD